MYICDSLLIGEIEWKNLALSHLETEMTLNPMLGTQIKWPKALARKLDVELTAGSWSASREC